MLTHEQVRALRDYHREELCAHHDAPRPEDCSLCGLHAIGVALCEEWLARRTVRWGDSDAEERSGRLYCDEPGRWYGFYVRPWLGRFDVRVNEQRGIDAEGATLDTLAEARAWLEERAREAGYEVSK